MLIVTKKVVVCRMQMQKITICETMEMNEWYCVCELPQTGGRKSALPSLIEHETPLHVSTKGTSHAILLAQPESSCKLSYNLRIAS
jgi:hypothetical protein